MTGELQAFKTKSSSISKLDLETEIELKGNKSKWHIFIPGKKKCLCGHKKRTDFMRNHLQKTKTVQQTLENPHKGLLGKITVHGLNNLRKRVNQQ